VETTDKVTFFKGLFVQARTVQSGSYNTGSFDVLRDSQLQVLTCGNSTDDVGSSRVFVLSGITDGNSMSRLLRSSTGLCTM